MKSTSRYARVLSWIKRTAKESVVFRWSHLLWCSTGLGRKSEQDFLFEFARAHHSVFILQIGANDGVTRDPIHWFINRYKWDGLLLEPVPQTFAKLAATYGGRSNLVLVNAALAQEDGLMTLHAVAMEPGVPDWCNRLASFSLETVLSHKYAFPDIENYVYQQPVEALTFARLVEQYGIDRLDVVMIDVEGYDYQVLKQIDFVHFAPNLVIFEHAHLPEIESRAAVKLLIENGYEVYKASNMDFVAVRIGG
jgi:FkbM family methyltransferase